MSSAMVLDCVSSSWTDVVSCLGAADCRDGNAETASTTCLDAQEEATDACPSYLPHIDQAIRLCFAGEAEADPAP